MDSDGESAFQVIEIRYYSDLDARERSITDRQVWRYDEESKRWWLHGDLPDFCPR